VLERIPIVQHTAMSSACQCPPLADAPNHTVIARFGNDVCAAGHTSVPNLVRRYWSQLGATAGDYICYESIIEFQRTTAPPQVYVPLIAAAMGRPNEAGERQVREHTAHLVGLDLLHVRHTGRANVYDFGPLYSRVAELHADASTTPTGAADAPISQIRLEENPPSDRRGSPPNEDVSSSRFDSIPPNPPLHTSYETADPETDQREADAVAALVAEISEELGDAAPRSSRTRAEALRSSLDVNAAAFSELADQARRVVRQRLRRGPPLRRPMAYWFDVLDKLLIDEEGQQDDHQRASSDAAQSSPRRQRRQRRQWREKEAVAATTGPMVPTEPMDHIAPEPLTPADPIEGEATTETGPGDEIWRRVVAELATTMTAENHRQWIAGTTAALVDEEAIPLLRVAAPSDFNRMWLDKRLRGQVERATARVDGGIGVQVEFVVTAR